MKQFLVSGNARPITPDCDREDCVVQQNGPTWTTLIGWHPTMDKYGNPLSKDPNTSSTPMKCLTCGKEWTHTL